MADMDPGLPHCVRLLNHLQGNQIVVQFSFNFLRKLRKGVGVKFHGLRNIKFSSFLNFREDDRLLRFATAYSVVIHQVKAIRSCASKDVKTDHSFAPLHNQDTDKGLESKMLKSERSLIRHYVVTV